MDFAQAACIVCGRPDTVADLARARCRACGGELVASSPEAVTTADAGSGAASEVDRARLDPRRRLGRFLLLAELGRGGMGVVYRAWDEQLRRVVALKTLIDIDGTARAALDRFRHEAEAIARLRHPSIVSLHDRGQIDGKHYLVMDLIEGPTLDKRLREARFPLEKGVSIVRDVARALHYAHEQGVVHRDLKPQNVILDAQDRPYVLDFGLARLVDSKSRVTKTGVALGTPAYMPPEQAEGKAARIGPTADVYSLGATLYHVLTGRAPFSGDSEVQVLAALLTRDPVPPSAFEPRAAGDLEAICLRCLEKDPARRYTSAAALAEDLDRFLRHERTLAQPRGALSRLLRGARGNGVALLAFALFAGAALGTAAVGGLSSGKEPEKDGEKTGEKPRPATTAVPAKKEQPLPKLVGRIDAGFGLHANGVSPFAEQGRVFVGGLTDEDAPETRVVDLATGERKGTLPVFGCSMDAQRRLLVGVNLRGGEVLAYELPGLRPLWKKQIGYLPSGTAIDAGTGLIYVMCQGGGGDDPTFVLRESDGEVVKGPIGCGGVAGRVLVDPSTHRAFAVDVAGHTAKVIGPPPGLDVERTYRGSVVAFDAPRHRLLFVGDLGQISYADAVTGATTVSGERSESGMFDVDPVTGRIYDVTSKGVRVLAGEPLREIGTIALEAGCAPKLAIVAGSLRRLYVTATLDGNYGHHAVFVFELPEGKAPSPASLPGKWTKAAPLKAPRAGAAAGVLDGRIYVVGGGDRANDKHGTNEAYDVVADAWSDRAPLPTERSFSGCNLVPAGARLHAVGDTAPGYATNVVEAYDPASDSWSALPEMPTPRCHLAVVSLAKKIYAIGGTPTDGQTDLTTLEIYDSKTRVWTAGPPMPTGRRFLAACAAAGKIYAIGGTTSSSEVLSAVEAFDPETGAWSRKAPLPTPRYASGVGFVGGTIRVVGGQTGAPGKTATTAVESYDPATDSWAADAPLATPRSHLATAVLDGKLYAIGGTTGTEWLASVEVFTPSP